MITWPQEIELNRKAEFGRLSTEKGRNALSEVERPTIILMIHIKLSERAKITQVLKEEDRLLLELQYDMNQDMKRFLQLM